MAVKYRMEFDTTAGSDINWQLDILQVGYVGAVLPMIGTSDPVEINYQSDNDIYKPITGSSAKINLVVTDDVTYDDFNTGSLREYEVRLRYEDNTPVTIQETLTATGQANVGATRTNIFLNQQDRQRFFEIFLPGVVYTETDNDIATTRGGTLNGVALPLGTTIRNNSSRTSVRGNFNFGTGAVGTTFIIAAVSESTVLQDYWCGFINPIDSQESVTTNPFTVSFTATDGLGLLEQLSIDRAAADDSGLLFGYIHRALKQTGLELDILVDSKIMTTTGSAILSVLSSPDAFKPEEGGTEGTLKESLEGVLETFNYKVFQSNARWYVVNCSTHGGSGETEDVIWNTFDADGLALPNSSESLRYSVVEGGDLIPANSDLTRNFRRPIGSVEARPENLTQTTAVENFDFSQGGRGWNANGSIDTALSFNETTFLTGGRSIATNRNRENADNDGAIWFRSEGARVESSLPTTLEIDWRILDGPNNESYKNARFFYRVYVDLGAPLTVFGVDATPRQISRMYYEHDRGHWYVRPTAFARLQQSGDDWQNTSVELAPVMTTDNRIEIESGTSIAATIFIEFTYGAADTTGFWERGRREESSTSSMQVLVDRVQLVGQQIDDDFTNPVYEYRQDNHTRTIDYNPKFISQGPATFRERLSETEYWREGETQAQSGLLEQLVTRQKLNDFRDSFTYYEGSFINNTLTPLSQIHKPLIQLSSEFTETSSCIMNGGSFNPKKNIYKVNMYVPNQVEIPATSDRPFQPADVPSVLSDGSDAFTPFNVDLILPGFIANTKAAYTFDFELNITDAMGVGALEGTVTTSEPFVSLLGSPGDVVPYTLKLVTSVGNIALANTYSLATATEDTPLPNFITFGEFYDISSGNVAIDLQITLPDRAEAETVYIDGQFQVFMQEEIPDAVASSVVVTNTGTNLSGATVSTYEVNGRPGDVKHFTHSIAPATNFQLFSGNFDATNSDSSLTNLDAVGGMDLVNIAFAYTVPTTGESVSVTVTGDASPLGTIGVDLFTRTVNFGTAPVGTRFHEGSNVFTGIPASTKDYFITVIPDADKFISNIAQPTLPAGISANGAPYPAGENWEIPIQVTIPGSSDTLSVGALTATVINEPYSLTFNANNVGLDNAVVTGGPVRQTYDDDDFGDSIAPFAITITPSTEMMFESLDALTFDINEASVVSEDGSIISLPESQFVGVPVLTNGTIVLTISGNFPSTGGQYTLDINVAGRSIQLPSTSVTVDVPHVGIPATGGAILIHVTADGAWETGSSDGIVAGSAGGRYGPTSGMGSGVITVELPYLPVNSNARSIGIVVRSTDGTNNNQVNLSQSDQFGQRIVFASAAEFALFTPSNPAQPGILYITPLV